MSAVKDRGAAVHGLDINPKLAALSSDWGPAMVGELPVLGFISLGSYDGAYCVLVLEHIEDHGTFFEAVGAIVRPEGVLALVMNHPIWTAPGSTPVSDTDGEVLWRSGDYFSSGTTEEPGRSPSRSSPDDQRAAQHCCGCRLGLKRMIEAPHHELTHQPGIPRLLACRWRLLP